MIVLIGHTESGVSPESEKDEARDTNQEAEPVDIFSDVVQENHSLLRNAVVQAASRLGVFELFRSASQTEPFSPPEVASQLGLPVRRLNRLLDILVAEGILSPASPGKPEELRLKALPPLTDQSAGPWDRLADVIRADRPLELDPAWLEGHLTYVKEKSQAVAPILWRALKPRAGSRLLDMGGGLGGFSLAFLHHHPANSATLLDFPEVLRLLRKAASASPAALTAISGDAREWRSPSDHDVVLLANVLHLYGPEEGRTLVQNAASAAAPDGRVIIWDLKISPDRTGPLASLYFALNMALFTEAGDVHPPEEITAWMSEGGLGSVTEAAVAQCPHSLCLVGTRSKA